MKAKKIGKIIGIIIIAAVIVSAVLGVIPGPSLSDGNLAIISINVAKYSNDGYTLYFQKIGFKSWQDSTRVQLLIKDENGKKINSYRTYIWDKNGVDESNIHSVYWGTDTVTVTLCGNNMSDQALTMRLDGYGVELPMNLDFEDIYVE